MKLVRRLASSLMLLMVMGVLAACGGSAAEAPEVRAENFFKDFVAAFNDPKISDAATQDQWADKLSKYFVPEQQAAQKTDILGSLQQLGALGSELNVKVENLKVEKVSESGDDAEIKIVSGTMSMSVMGEEQTTDMATEGFGSSSSTSKMKKVDSVWYIIP